MVAEEFPAIGLALEPSHSDIMKRKPRDPKESMPSRPLMIYTLGIAAAIVAGTLGCDIITLQSNPDLSYARTVASWAWAFSRFTMPTAAALCRESVFRMNPLGNKTLLMGIAASILAILAVVYIPFMQFIFERPGRFHPRAGF